MEKIKTDDFVEINYTGKLKENNIIFDTTDETLAKENMLHNKSIVYKPVIICVGKHQILKGIDDALIGKEAGSKFTITLGQDEAFGRKDIKNVQLVATNKFTKEKINPMPGLTVNVDGMNGVVKTVAGGRTIVDFNHPLAGKDVVYDIEVVRLVTDQDEKIQSFMDLTMHLGAHVKTLDGKTKITLHHQLPKEIHDLITAQLKAAISDKLDIEYVYHQH